MLYNYTFIRYIITLVYAILFQLFCYIFLSENDIRINRNIANIVFVRVLILTLIMYMKTLINLFKNAVKFYMKY